VHAVPKHQPNADPHNQLQRLGGVLKSSGNTWYAERDKQRIATDANRQQLSRRSEAKRLSKDHEVLGASANEHAKG